MQRIHKIKTHYSNLDYYKFYKKRYNNDMDRKLYVDLISEFNKEIVNLVIEEGLIYRLPKLYLELMIKKTKNKPYIKNGKLVNHSPPDWVKTNKLWETNEEAKANKVIVRYNNSHSSGYVFKIYCKKFKCKLKYKNLYKYKPSRKFQRDLSKRIKDPDKDNFDCYLLY